MRESVCALGPREHPIVAQDMPGAPGGAPLYILSHKSTQRASGRLPGAGAWTRGPEGQDSPSWLLGILVFAVSLQGCVHLLPQRLHLGRVREPLGVCEEGAAGQSPSPSKLPPHIPWLGRGRQLREGPLLCSTQDGGQAGPTVPRAGLPLTNTAWIVQAPDPWHWKLMGSPAQSGAVIWTAEPKSPAEAPDHQGEAWLTEPRGVQRPTLGPSQGPREGSTAIPHHEQEAPPGGRAPCVGGGRALCRPGAGCTGVEEDDGTQAAQLRLVHVHVPHLGHQLRQHPEEEAGESQGPQQTAPLARAPQ